MKRQLEPGAELEGFTIEACIHSGSIAHVYRVRHSLALRDPGFPLAMKVPRRAVAEGVQDTVSFEVENHIMQVLKGPHVPRFVATGDLQNMPYLVTEYVHGKSLGHWLGASERPAVDALARLGVAVARAVHSLHQQNTVHLDLKPANVLIRDDGSAVLLGLGLSFHAHYPDLLAGQLSRAVGSPAWMAPEQVVGVRGDLRSDIFAIGVMLYQLATGELPFGSPRTTAGLRQRLWTEPAPLRGLRPDLPEWMQEVIVNCLQSEAARRYPSAAHLAFDLNYPEQVIVTERGRKVQRSRAATYFRRWFKATGLHYQPSPLPALQAATLKSDLTPDKDAPF